MSLETWKKQFYPINAKDVPKKDAIKHSLKKWTGLRATNLKKHKVKQSGPDIIDEEGLVLSIVCNSCALCIHYLENEWYEGREQCSRCPLYKALNNNACDSHELSGGPYSKWVSSHDPEPMIKALRKALKPKPKKKT